MTKGAGKGEELTVWQKEFLAENKQAETEESEDMPLYLRFRCRNWQCMKWKRSTLRR